MALTPYYLVACNVDDLRVEAYSDAAPTVSHCGASAEMANI